MNEPPHATCDVLAARAAAHLRDGRADKARPHYDAPEVQEVVARCARRAAIRFGADDRGVHLGLAYEKVWNALSTFDGERRFEPWCCTIVRNAVMDLIRARTKLREREISESDCSGGDGSGPVAGAVDRTSAPPPDFDLAALFASHDLAVLKEWPLATRVLILGVYGLWRKVSAEDWAEWLEECGIEDCEDFSRELECERIDDQIELVGTILGLKQNTARQRWNRRRHWIVRLKWFWTETLTNHTRLNDSQINELMSAPVLPERLAVVCLAPNWFRARSQDEFATIVDLHDRRADFPWLRFSDWETPEFDDRLVLLASPVCGLKRNADELNRIWCEKSKLRSQLRCR